eukprot:CAMPEP_0174358806 /NCGR_PEP_ID=MMETSP0811_2-20130205/44769_1 /TAXON_ID=73025 ORGANISM="Eutreptiella gymnastica-like, Strain CCMP1594" /NCGR_SAMPLE_ID=MMETSP0811_2 /ASSEMBLY_ACC=CAM_ASM_000667 /LENGTH=75 /DNA_ID=CAMNT_0015492897 /DNA_START=32 /DNA_END=256 /DNA_ORIENTATION=+
MSRDTECSGRQGVLKFQRRPLRTRPIASATTIEGAPGHGQRGRGPARPRPDHGPRPLANAAAVPFGLRVGQRDAA